MASCTKGRPCLFISTQVPRAATIFNPTRKKRGLTKAVFCMGAANLIYHSAYYYTRQGGVVGKSKALKAKKTEFEPMLSLTLSKLLNFSKFHFPHPQEITN